MLMAVLLALAARLGGLGEGFWIDEVISSDTAAMPTLDLLARSGLADVHPPAYYLLLKVWSQLAGGGDLAARMLTLLLSLATVALVTAVAEVRFGATSAWVAGLVLALSPFHAHYGVEVRSYTLLGLAVLVALVAQERFLDRPERRGRQVGFALSLSALLWIHTLGVLLAALLVVHALLSARRSALTRLRDAALLAAATFAPWVPLLLVQIRHQPPAMTAHLSAPLPLHDLVAAHGPAALGWPTGLAAALGALALLGGGRGLRARDPAPDPAPLAAAPARASWPLLLPALVLALAGPLLPLVVLPLSPLTFDLVAGETGPAYGVVALAALGIWGACHVALRAPRRPVSAPLALLVGFLVLLGLVDLARPILNLRNTLPVLPILALGLGGLVATRPRFAVALAVLWVGLSAPSLAALADRATDGAIPARDDLRGAALLVDDPGATVVVIPQWDVPALSRYLEPDRSILGALDPGDLDLEASSRLMVILTRDAARDPEPFLAALERTLAGRLVRGKRWRLRGSPAVEVVRYGPPDPEERSDRHPEGPDGP
jgi:4-amino-4-deoxy-L-arabinose transferase-like glycosyltransferase